MTINQKLRRLKIALEAAKPGQLLVVAASNQEDSITCSFTLPCGFQAVLELPPEFPDHQIPRAIESGFYSLEVYHPNCDHADTKSISLNN